MPIESFEDELFIAAINLEMKGLSHFLSNRAAPVKALSPVLMEPWMPSFTFMCPGSRSPRLLQIRNSWSRSDFPGQRGSLYKEMS